MPSDPKTYIIIGAIVATLFFLFAGINQVETFFERRKEKPTPSETYLPIKQWQILQTTQDARIAKVEIQIETTRSEIQGMSRALNQDDETRSVAIHNRLNKVESECAATTSAINLLSGRLAQMDAKLDRLMETKKDK